MKILSIVLLVAFAGAAKAEVATTVSFPLDKGFYEPGDLNNIVRCLDHAQSVFEKDGFLIGRKDPVIDAKREDGATIKLECAIDRMTLDIAAPDERVLNVLADDDYLKP